MDYFFLSVRNFYAKAVYEFKTRFNFEDDVCKSSQWWKPKNARKLSPQSLSCLFMRYPLLRDHVNEDDADNEWRAHVNLSCDYFNVSEDFEFHNMDAEFYWKRVFASKSPSGKIRFPILNQYAYPSSSLCRLVTQPLKDFSAIWKTPNLLRKKAFTTNRSML